MRILKVITLISAALLLVECRHKNPTPQALTGRMERGMWYCDTPENLAMMGFVSSTQVVPSASTSAVSAGPENIGQTVQPLYEAAWTLWETKEIPVCWEDATYNASEATEREWTRTAVQDTWESALCGAEIPADQCLKFVGWTKCSDGNDTGIRIQVGDINPRTTELGKRLAGVSHGMSLDFTFLTWSPVCSSNEAMREYCIRAIAAHEFGHALGLSHEQNRGDTPATCDQAPQGTFGNVYLGPWDNESIMNYCAPNWNNDGHLSVGDIQWIRVAYYPEYYSELCVPLSVYDPSLSQTTRDAGVPDSGI